jgi:SAM-dependent methyltransferase
MPDTRPDAPPASEADALARLYDLDLLEDPGDLDLYRALTTRTDGPVLELAVGSGRIAIPLAEAGHAVTGVDRDPAMLARARAAARMAGVEDRLDLVEADMTEVRLPDAGSFGLVVLGLNSLFLLETRPAQQAAIRTMAAHLRPGGVAVVDIWQPDAEDLARFDGRLALEYVRLDPESGLIVTKTASARHDPSAQQVTLTAIYDEGRSGEPTRRWVRVDRLRLLSADELCGMALDAGLEVEVLAGSHDLEPIAPAHERAILVAVRPG